MNPPLPTIGPRSIIPARRGFTLIELLVVIAVIALLAGLIVPLAGLASKKRTLSRARTEIDNLALAIDTYKAKKGVYPPDNPAQPAGAFTNQLFYELWGMVVQNPPGKTDIYFTNTFNANEWIDAATLTKFFSPGTSQIGIVNSSTDTNEIINFIPRINAAEIQNINIGGSPPIPVWVFAIPSAGPVNGLPVPPGAGYPPVNVIRYVSTNPTNNPTSYDLWVDVLIAGKTNRISNWSKDPQIVNY